MIDTRGWPARCVTSSSCASTSRAEIPGIAASALCDLRGARNENGPPNESAMSKVPEQTRPGPVYSPAVDIFETDAAITVLVDMPGVKPEQLEIELRDSVLTVKGRVASPEATSESDVL